MIKSHAMTVLNFLLLGMKLNTASFLIPLLYLSNTLYTKILCLSFYKNLSTFSKSDYLLLKELIVSTVLQCRHKKITQFQHQNPTTLKTTIIKLMIPIITTCGNSWTASIQTQLVIHTLYYSSGSSKNWQCKIGFVELNPMSLCFPVSSVILF